MAFHPPAPATTPPSACTQMILFKLNPGANLKESISSEGKIWAETVAALKRRTDVRRLYWGLGLEESSTVHLHIVRERLHQHYDFLASSDYTDLKTRLKSVVTGNPIVRHAHLVDYTPDCEALGKGAPFTGTAIYVGTENAWDFAWQLWTTIVPKVKGCRGVAGGYIVEPIDGHERCFIAWVGWNSVEEHEGYHHTKHWLNRRAILEQGHKGFREYGHVVFSQKDTPLSRL